jgi:hypothetical protein
MGSGVRAAFATPTCSKPNAASSGPRFARMLGVTSRTASKSSNGDNSPGGDQQVFELVLPPKRCSRTAEVLDDHAVSVVDREPIGTGRLEGDQIPSHQFGARHEKVEHGPSHRKPGARPSCSALHVFTPFACPV